MAIPENPITREEQYLEAMVAALNGGGGGGGSSGVEVITLDAQTSAAFLQALQNMVTLLNYKQIDDAAMFVQDGDFSRLVLAARNAVNANKMPMFVFPPADPTDSGHAMIPTTVSFDLGIMLETAFNVTASDGEGISAYKTYLFSVVILNNQVRLIGRRLVAEQ